MSRVIYKNYFQIVHFIVYQYIYVQHQTALSLAKDTSSQYFVHIEYYHDTLYNYNNSFQGHESYSNLTVHFEWLCTTQVKTELDINMAIIGYNNASGPGPKYEHRLAIRRRWKVHVTSPKL